MNSIDLVEHESWSYVPRTYANAKEADLTIAFATDFSTAGERCTSIAAGRKYVAIPLSWKTDRMVGHIKKYVYELNAKILNIAGNGIYTLKEFSVTQAEANLKVYEVLKEVHKTYPLELIRSGGQTGIDTAGLVAGIALDIPVLGLFPRGYRQRDECKVDYSYPKDVLIVDLISMAMKLNPELDMEGYQ